MTITERKASSSIQDIGGRAMLVGLQIKQFGGVKTDKKITAEVAEANHMEDASMGRYKKNILPKDALATIKRLAGEIRAEHYRRTLPWAEDGARILTREGYAGYQSFMERMKPQWDAAVDAFLSTWDDHVAVARRMLNGTFNEADYPRVEKVRASFGIRSIVRPVPLADDFRVALGSDEIDAIKATLQCEMDTTAREAMADVYRQIGDVVKTMVESLKAFNPAKHGAERGTFRDSLVTNVSDLLAILPTLNLTGDGALDILAEDMRKLTQFTGEELRDNAWKRAQTADAAEAILNQMAQLVG